MIIKANFKIGEQSYQIEDEGTGQEVEMLAMQKVMAISNPRKICNLCQNADPDNFEVESRIAKSYIFIKIVCKKCGAKSDLGRYKDKPGYFWKEFEKYEKKEGTE